MGIPLITRRELGAIASPLFPSPWHESIQQAIGWNRRTMERLGTPKMPLDKRRIELLHNALCYERERHEDACDELANILFERL